MFLQKDDAQLEENAKAPSKSPARVIKQSETKPKDLKEDAPKSNKKEAVKTSEKPLPKRLACNFSVQPTTSKEK